MMKGTLNSTYLTVLVSLFTLLGGNLCSAEDLVERWTTPFWAGNTMHGESLFFIQESGEARPESALLFPAKRILDVIQPHTGMVYLEGADYVLSKDGTSLSLPEGSRIAFRTREELYPPAGADHTYPAKRDSDRHMLFGEGHFFHDMQVEVTYTHKRKLWEQRGGYVPKPAFNELPKTRDKIWKGEPLTIVLLGDSISTGANASGPVGSAPFTPSYGWLVAERLRQQYRCPVTFKNFSVGGKATGWGVEVAPEIAKEKPDLAIIAFGMNDASGRVEKDQYIANTSAIMDIVRSANADAEFILVATMTGNPDWTATSTEHYDLYREGLLELLGNGVAVADMTSVWKELLEHKPFVSFTGNGVNHPNDFGHRLYAQVILGLLR
jgi:lysophospholipase L1-like esterase